MFRYLSHALPLLLLLLAVFGGVVGVLDLEPRQGSVMRIALFEQPAIPGSVVLTAWLMEACGLLALYLLAQGRCGLWWLDGLLAGWLAWVFRGPIFVLTVVVASRQPQEPWWQLSFAWFLLYSVCGLSLAILARIQGLTEDDDEPEAAVARHHRETQPTEPEGEGGRLLPPIDPAVEAETRPASGDAEDGDESDEGDLEGDPEDDPRDDTARDDTARDNTARDNTAPATERP